MSESTATNQKSIAFIGAGNMATCIVGGLIENGWAKSKIRATARSEETLESVKTRFDVQVTHDNHQAVRQSDIVVLCVKPHIMKTVLAGSRPNPERDQTAVDIRGCWH